MANKRRRRIGRRVRAGAKVHQQIIKQTNKQSYNHHNYINQQPIITTLPTPPMYESGKGIRCNGMETILKRINTFTFKSIGLFYCFV